MEEPCFVLLYQCAVFTWLLKTNTWNAAGTGRSGTSSKVLGNAKASGKKEQGRESQSQVDPRLYPGKEAIGIFRESLCCYIPTPGVTLR